MAKCEICSKTVKTVYSCDECGARFCENCGDKNKLMCQDCLAYEESLKSGYRPEQEIEVEVDDTD